MTNRLCKSPSMYPQPFTLKLMVDKATNNVAFLEADKGFVDVLLSFLTLPLGTVFRLIDKPSSFGSIDKLYSCVETFDGNYLINDTCKNMLLRPRNAAIHFCNRLQINLDDSDSGKYYTCPSSLTRLCDFSLIGCFPNVKCECGKEMSTELKWFSTTPEVHGGGFVQVSKFAIADDLSISPICGTTSILEKLGFKDWRRLEEKIVKIGHKEVLQLLKRSLLTKTPLTDVFLQREQRVNPRVFEFPTEISDSPTSNKIILILVVNNNKLLFAEAKHDFVDLLFSFLTFPMGSIARNLGAQSCLGCVDNLYSSAENLSSLDCLKREGGLKILNPKLPPGVGCRNQLVRIEEEQQQRYYMYRRPKKTKDCGCLCVTTTRGVSCRCGKPMNLLLSLDGAEDPTSYSKKICETGGGGYTRSVSTAYMVTDELVVTPLSIVYDLSLRRGAKGSVEELEIEMGEAEAVELLRASLTSKTVLTDTFLCPKSGRLSTPATKKFKSSPAQ